MFSTFGVKLFFAGGTTGKGMVVNKRTGVGFNPAAANGTEPDRELPGDVPRNTNPLTPKPMSSPMSPNVGANAGIETMRGDTEGPQR